MKKILTIFLTASLLLVAYGKDKEEKKETTKQEAIATDEQKSSIFFSAFWQLFFRRFGSYFFGVLAVSKSLAVGRAHV